MTQPTLKLTLTLIALAAVLANGTVFGQPNDFAEQLILSNEEQFTRIFPVGEDVLKLTEKIERSVHLLTAAIDRKLPPDSDDEDKDELAKQQANAAVVLLRLNQPSKVWPLLTHSPDPGVRNYLIHRIGPLGVDSKIIIKHLEVEPDITIRRALLLSLGEFDETALPLANRTAMIPMLQEMYRNNPDPGLHSAVEWLYRQWHDETWLKQVNEDWATGKEQREMKLVEIEQLLSKDKLKSSPQWYVNGQGQTMVVIPGPIEFVMGSPVTEVGQGYRKGDEQQHTVRIGRNFSIASKEVTVKQFLRFRNEHGYHKKYAPTDDCPVNSVTWYEAADYCNWLNGQEEIPKEQWCYEANRDGKYEAGMRMTSEFLQRTGYRLPTEEEWEYACRAGTVTRYSFGVSDDLIGKYAWFHKNSSEMSHSVGSLKPNDFGLFDMHGNGWEWCQDVFGAYDGSKAKTMQEEHLLVNDNARRVLRNISFLGGRHDLRSAFRYGKTPAFRHVNKPPWPPFNLFGFRLSRTLPSADSQDGR